MTQRLALALSLVALAAVIGGFVLVAGRLDRLSNQVAALERPKAPLPPALPPPAAPAPAPQETARDAERKKMKELADRENQEQFEAIAKRLGLEAALEAKLKEAFAEEFAYYSEGVLRALKNIEADDTAGDENYLASASFRRGLEERIAATNEKAHALLNAFQQSTFDDWRREMRRERYELD